MLRLRVVELVDSIFEKVKQNRKLTKPGREALMHKTLVMKDDEKDEIKLVSLLLLISLVIGTTLLPLNLH